ncbi:hypothetical protein RRG08_059526, partial [Elysia crispata]
FHHHHQPFSSHPNIILIISPSSIITTSHSPPTPTLFDNLTLFPSSPPAILLPSQISLFDNLSLFHHPSITTMPSSPAILPSQHYLIISLSSIITTSHSPPIPTLIWIIFPLPSSPPAILLPPQHYLIISPLPSSPPAILLPSQHYLIISPSSSITTSHSPPIPTLFDNFTLFHHHHQPFSSHPNII